MDKVRRKIGKQLAHDAPVPTVPEGEKRPVVIAVPDSSNTATLGYVSECNKLDIPCKYDIGLIRNHYVGRTFISPGQNKREMKVRCKFSTVDGVLKDRIVVMVDVANQKTRSGLMDDYTNIATDSNGPEVWIPGLINPMKLQ